MSYIALVPPIYTNILQQGADSTGVADSTSAIQNSINLLTSGGTVYSPPGQFKVTSPITLPANNIKILGAGRNATTWLKNGNFDLFDISGTAAGGANHRRWINIKDMTLSGNNHTGKLIRAYYVSYLVCDSVRFLSNNDMALESAEFYDSYFINCSIDLCGDTAGNNPAFYLKNAAATVGNFGYTTDNTNMIWFVNCRWESFYNGALWVDALNGNTNSPNGIYLVNCKMETVNFRGPMIKLGSTVIGFHAVNLYLSGDTFASGFSTPQPAIQVSAKGDYSFDNVLANSNAALFSSVIELSPSQAGFGAVKGLTVTGTAPTIAAINFATANTGATLRFENIKLTGATNIFANNTGNSQISNIIGHDHLFLSSGASSTHTPDVLNKGNIAFYTMNGATTFNAPAMKWPGARCLLIMQADASGPYSITWNAIYKNNQNALPTTIAANATISVEFVSDGTNWYRVN